MIQLRLRVQRHGWLSERRIAGHFVDRIRCKAAKKAGHAHPTRRAYGRFLVFSARIGSIGWGSTRGTRVQGTKVRFELLARRGCAARREVAFALLGI